MQPDLAKYVGAPPEGATHWGLQRAKAGKTDGHKGWSSLVFAEDEDGVCLHERPIADLSLAAIREVSDGAAGNYRVKWLAEDEEGVPKQMNFGKHFTLAASGGDSVAPPTARPRAAMAAPAAQGAPDMLAFMLEMMKGDRERDRDARERADREAREAREERQKREDRDERDRREKREREEKEADRKWELERERMRADLVDRAKQAETLTTIAKAIEANAAGVAALSERLDELEDGDDDDDDEPSETGKPDGWMAIAQDLAPVVKKGAETLLSNFAQGGGAAE